MITTVAGTANQGYSGDGGPATSARLQYPGGIAVDAAGNFFFADSSNGVVRKVTAATGVITTAAGGYFASVLGDNGPATAAALEVPQGVALDVAGNLYVADFFDSRIRAVRGPIR